MFQTSSPLDNILTQIVTLDDEDGRSFNDQRSVRVRGPGLSRERGQELRAGPSPDRSTTGRMTTSGIVLRRPLFVDNSMWKKASGLNKMAKFNPDMEATRHSRLVTGQDNATMDEEESFTRTIIRNMRWKKR